MSDVSLLVPPFQKHLPVLQNLICQNVQAFSFKLYSYSTVIVMKVCSVFKALWVFLLVNKWKKGLFLVHPKASRFLWVCLKLPNKKKGSEFVLIFSSENKKILILFSRNWSNRVTSNDSCFCSFWPLLFQSQFQIFCCWQDM